MIHGSAPDHIWGPMDENFERKAEKLMAWLLPEWPKDEKGNPEGIRIFILSPEDIAYIAADKLNEKGVERLTEMDAGDLIHGVSKRLEYGLEDWSVLVWDQVYFDFLRGTDDWDDLVEDC